MEKTLSKRLIYDGRAFKVWNLTVEMPVGRETTRDIVEHANCIAVIPVDRDGNILMVRQFRKSVDKELLEIPAGGIEPGEKPDEAVIREMQEETGFKPEKIVRLGGFYSSPGFCTEYLYLYLATELIASPLVAEDTEEIKVVPTPPSNILQLIASREIQDSKSIAGLLQYLYLHAPHS